MSTKYKIGDQGQFYFLCFAVIYWVDVFIMNYDKQLLLDSVRFYRMNEVLEVNGGQRFN